MPFGWDGFTVAFGMELSLIVGRKAVTYVVMKERPNGHTTLMGAHAGTGRPLQCHMPPGLGRIKQVEVVELHCGNVVGMYG